ncbi:MAG: Bacterial regulatory helix-turn-helix protein lysR family [Trebonia sp.]|nr:Bacterial regulatory helix-turn-helix protein lysR family [Trebonia sp.]
MPKAGFSDGVADIFLGFAVLFAVMGLSFLARANFIYAGRRTIGLSPTVGDIAFARDRLVRKHACAYRGGWLAGIGLACLILDPAGHPSILAAAQALGLWQAALYQQVGRLERACGGPLVNRRPRPAGTAILTPLGQQLCRQARDYLGLQFDPVPPARPDPGELPGADASVAPCLRDSSHPRSSLSAQRRARARSQASRFRSCRGNAPTPGPAAAAWPRTR